MNRLVSLIALPAMIAAGPVLAQTALAQTATPATPAQSAPAAGSPAAATPAAASKPPLPAQVESRITTLHKRLQITSAQEADWNKFAQAMRDNAASSAQAYQDRANNLATMNAVENLQAYVQLEQARAQGLQGLLTAFQPLYNDLSPEQKTIADTMFRRQGERQARKAAAKKPAQ
jgi:periplasmic protein CpxP/Spy